MMRRMAAETSLRFLVPMNMSRRNYFMFIVAATLLWVVIQQ